MPTFLHPLPLSLWISTFCLPQS